MSASVVVTGIAELVTHDPRHPGPLGLVADAAVVVERGRVAWTGPAPLAPAADERLDVGGRAVIPGFVDSHSHLLFAGDRAGEFEARMAGRRYDGGGIRVPVAATRAAADEQLEAGLLRHLGEMRSQGTTTVEVKSGYGLTVARRGAVAGDRRPVHLGDHLPRRPRGARRSTPTTRPATSTS